MDRDRMTLGALLAQGQLISAQLQALVESGPWWPVEAPGLEWTSRQAVDHLCNTLAFYVNHAVTEADAHLPRIRSVGDVDLSDRDLARTVGTWTLLLHGVLSSWVAGSRGWHRLGRPDAEGYVALACNELLVHAYDVHAAHGVQLTAPHDVCARLLARLFPDVPRAVHDNAWQRLLRANGRIALPSRPRRQEWRSHPAPPRQG